MPKKCIPYNINLLSTKYLVYQNLLYKYYGLGSSIQETSWRGQGRQRGRGEIAGYTKLTQLELEKAIYILRLKFGKNFLKIW